MIRNSTRKTVITKNKKFLRSEFSKIKGLIFAKKIIDTGLIMVFKKEKITSLHMFLVFFPIDVLWLDRNKKVVDMKECFKPFRIIISRKPAQYIVELPDSAIKKSKTQIGDTVSF